ncbi:MAG: protein-disulfide reductase DsbD [Gammaproteobacteria bacterium]|nr:protein-disulfide reductase DsbD [Gammaproteobacteria bacterium]MCW9031281.1 protein-disulfide reductase DsbD [Gammaproteobacteria bacterium]
MRINILAKYLLILLSLFLTFNVAVVSAADSNGVEAVSDLSNDLGLGGNEDEILEPDVAFKLTTDVKDANNIVANWQIADKHYLYRDKFKFILKDGTGIELGNASLPPGETKNDEFFGKIQVFHNGAEAIIPVNRSTTDASSIQIQFTYQGCAEETGICYPPIRKTISFDLPAGGELSQVNLSENKGTEINTASTTSVAEKKAFVSEQDKSLQVLQSGDVIEILVYFFLGGLALAFTACMYPMIPILSSIIVGHGENISHSKAFTISMAYVQSMAITFGLLGAAVALFAGGVNLQAYFQSPWILIPFSLLFVALAFSMFGFYAIQMPASVQSWLSNFSNKQEGGSLHGAIFMGAASALIIGPCAGPVIIGALAYVAAESDPLVGFLAMFILGNGLGLPLLAVGTLGGHVLPKAGTWMDTVKAGAGVVLLAIAILFLERISFISSIFIMMLWATYFIVVGVYLGAFNTLKEGASGWFKLWKGLGIVFIIYGVIVMLGGVTGARNFNDPLHGSSLTMGSGSAVEKQHLKFKRIKTEQDLKNEIADAKAAGKYIMLDFYADWCTYCKQFEDYVFTNKSVQTLLKDFVLLQADVTANDEQDQALNKFTSVQAPPAILFFGKDGKEIRNYRIVGNMDAETFIKHVKQIINK